MTYKNCKKLIESGHYDRDEMLDKLDVFFLADRLTDDEYKELVGMLGVIVPEDEPEDEPEN